MVGGSKKILIVNVNWIGDVIFSTPFIKTIRDAYPDSYIACLLHPRCIDVLKDNPRIDEIIIYDEEGAHKGLIGKLKLIAYLRKKRFDIAFILHRSFTKALITFLAAVKERVGYPTKKRGMFLTKLVEISDEEIHKVEYFLNLARAYGIAVGDVAYEFFVKQSDRQKIKQFLNENGIGDKDLLIVLCPGGNWNPKRWPRENFAQLADIFIERLNAKVVISGAKKDIALAEDIGRSMKNRPVISCGKTDLKGLGALMERANLVVANDTGPMHIAVAMKSNVIALFGPTSAGLTGPYGKGSYNVISKNEECDVPCYDMTCTDNRCMALIKPEDVFKEALKLIKP
ncbi:MAG: lipopolysaccharide heptosyltransferase II [Candidatus Omnitrophota bacterium]|nr:lipopolysaccharide heptosyltransferase II [Candidatus Omnitrophota bacterium]